jgi:hypothetical protein
MNKRFFIAWVVIFIAWFIGSGVVHGGLLGADYKAMGAIFRTEADSQQYFPLMIFAHVLLSGAFVWIYARGLEAKPWLGQGIRFGIVIALLTIVPTYIIYFVVQPMPVALVCKQVAFDGTLIVMLAIITAFLYRDGSRG